MSQSYHPYLWDHGRLHVHPRRAEFLSRDAPMRAINQSGQIAGWYVDPCFCKTHGFLLSGGVYTVTDDPGILSSDIQGLNDSSQLVGVAEQQRGGGTTYPYLGVPEFFVIISFAPDVSTALVLTAINNSGDIAGYYFVGGESSGFVF